MAGNNNKMDRRAFFTLGLKKTARAAAEMAERRARRKAASFIRPPFAAEELDFIIRCTRSGDCIRACPHGVIFSLPARLGVELVGTPALDLLNRGCHLCEDWPCVRACTSGALGLPAPQEPPKSRPDHDHSSPVPPRLAPPQFARASIDPRHCLPFAGPECGACGPACPVPGAIEWNGTRPRINEQACLGCALCREACITTPRAINIRPV